MRQNPLKISQEIVKILPNPESYSNSWKYLAAREQSICQISKILAGGRKNLLDLETCASATNVWQDSEKFLPEKSSKNPKNGIWKKNIWLLIANWTLEIWTLDIWNFGQAPQELARIEIEKLLRDSHKIQPHFHRINFEIWKVSCSAQLWTNFARLRIWPVFEKSPGNITWFLKNTPEIVINLAGPRKLSTDFQ